MTDDWKKRKGYNEAEECPKETSFFDCLLQENFDSQTAQKVMDIFRQIGLPAPQTAKETTHSEHGGRLLFINDYGLVIRIENAELQRIDDSPWMLQPIASINAGGAVIEIIPAINYETNEANAKLLREWLRQDGINFWDCGARNVGRIPVSTPAFPGGIPVVIDRPSVCRLPKDSKEILHAQREMTQDDIEKRREAIAARERLYGPLRQLFNACSNDTRKMEMFWSECRRYAQEGKLPASWNDEASSDVHDEKASYAAGRAREYGATLKVAEERQRQALNSGAPAVARSLPRPA